MPRDSGISCENFNFRYTGLELQRQWENVHFRSLFCTPVLPIVGHGPADTLQPRALRALGPCPYYGNIKENLIYIEAFSHSNHLLILSVAVSSGDHIVVSVSSIKSTIFRLLAMT